MADIDRAAAAALINEQDMSEIIKEMPKSSAALSTFRTVNMGTKQARVPVLAALPTAGFVGESATAAEGVKPTSAVSWTDEQLVAEEIAVIIPIHENVFDDSAFNIWSEVRPLITEAMGKVVDEAVFFGTNKPATWGEALVPGAIAAGNTISVAANAGDDLVEHVNKTWGLVEDDGFDINIQYCARSLRQQLRGLRDNDNRPMYLTELRGDSNASSIMGEQLEFVRNGAWDNNAATLLVGDRSKAVIGMRQDITFKFLDQATVGGINLAERDMIALRAKFRLAYQVIKPMTREGGAAAHPFAALVA